MIRSTKRGSTNKRGAHWAVFFDRVMHVHVFKRNTWLNRIWYGDIVNENLTKSEARGLARLLNATSEN